MGFKDWIIKKLEADLEPKAGHIDLESLDDEKREELFIQFGEGDENLTRFLKTAYNIKAPSLFCCSGHDRRSAYVVLKVTDENIDLLRKVGKVLSVEDVVTDFTDDYYRGRYVCYRGKYIGTEWLSDAADIMENPEMYDEKNPTIYYHETIWPNSKPFGYDFKKKLLNMLRKSNIKKLPQGIENNEKQNDEYTPSWQLTEEEKESINEKNNSIALNIDNNIKDEIKKENRDENEI